MVLWPQPTRSHKAEGDETTGDGHDVGGVSSNVLAVGDKLPAKLLPSRLPCWSSKRPGPFLVGVGGGTASGKTSVANVVAERLTKLWGKGSVAAFSQDCFYKNLTEEQLCNVDKHNWDHPDAFDWQESVSVVKTLKLGGDVVVPSYDYANNRRFPIDKATCIPGGPPLRVVVVEGILLFHSDKLRDLFDLTLFVDVDEDERLCRRLQRDLAERGRDVDGVLAQYEQTVKPCYEAFCAPTKEFVDIVIPRGADNFKGIQVIIDVVTRNAQDR